jgi:hypothetical protein
MERSIAKYGRKIVGSPVELTETRHVTRSLAGDKVHPHLFHGREEPASDQPARLRRHRPRAQAVRCRAETTEAQRVMAVGADASAVLIARTMCAAHGTRVRLGPTQPVTAVLDKAR